MPHYDYLCPECEHVQEEFHKMTAKPRVECEECGARMKRIITSGQRPIFKGSGFYETDYRKPDKVNKNIKKHIKKDMPDSQLKAGGIDRKDL